MNRQYRKRAIIVSLVLILLFNPMFIDNRMVTKTQNYLEYKIVRLNSLFNGGSCRPIKVLACAVLYLM